MATSSTKPLAVITGASTGIGLELARQFAEHNFDLIIAADEPEINHAAETLKMSGTQVQPVEVDLATHEGNDKLYEIIKADGRPVDSLCINAGIGISGEFINTDMDKEMKLVGLNVMSAVHLSKLVLKDMVANNHGRVLITSSIAALMPGAYSATYNASKGFLLLFAEALRNELKDTGVTVTALMPGPTDTEFFRRADMEDTKTGAGKKDSPEVVARDGFEALMAGKDKIVSHNAKTKMQALLSEILPDTVKAEMHAKEARPGSATH
jgi:short-subunit dehydrogenase